MNHSRLVYSTETGRICPKCRQSVPSCTCKKKRAAPLPPTQTDGIIRVRRETKGRKGKTVTTVHGLDLGDEGLKRFAKDCKQHCGTGGTVRERVIVLQGDHRSAVKRLLEGQGYRVKIAGG